MPVVPAMPPKVPRAATVEDVADAIACAHIACNALARLSNCAPYQLRAGCRRISESIERAIASENW